jgi:hypothetical protein
MMINPRLKDKAATEPPVFQMLIPAHLSPISSLSLRYGFDIAVV